MINKKNLLGKEPETIGQKDAIHTAIVAVRAGKPITPGQRCGLNEHREAIPDSAKGLGVADPFLKAPIIRGQVFWLLLNQDEVPNVKHVWEHPDADFTPPTRQAERNKYIKKYAQGFRVTYEQMLFAAAFVVSHDRPAPYPGPMSREEMEKYQDDGFESHDFWSEWSSEASHDFPNTGSECCPEYDYPGQLFEYPVTNPTRETL